MGYFTRTWFQALIVIHVDVTHLNVHERVNVYKIAKVEQSLDSTSDVKKPISGENKFGNLWAVFE